MGFWLVNDPYFLVNFSQFYSGYHGVGGPWQTKFVYKHPILEEVMKAGKELGYKEIDQNGPEEVGQLINYSLMWGSYFTIVISVSKVYIIYKRNAKDETNQALDKLNLYVSLLFFNVVNAV